MSDAVWIKVLDTVPITIGAFSAAVLAIYQIRTKKSAKSAEENSAEAVKTTGEIRERQIEIKSQTDGQLDKLRRDIHTLNQELIQVYRENAALQAILSARENKPAGEAVRHDDPIVKLTGQPAGDGGGNQHRRRNDKDKT